MLTPKKSFRREAKHATSTHDAAFCQGRLMNQSITSLRVSFRSDPSSYSPLLPVVLLGARDDVAWGCCRGGQLGPCQLLLLLLLLLLLPGLLDKLPMPPLKILLPHEETKPRLAGALAVRGRPGARHATTGWACQQHCRNDPAIGARWQLLGLTKVLRIYYAHKVHPRHKWCLVDDIATSVVL